MGSYSASSGELAGRCPRWQRGAPLSFMSARMTGLEGLRLHSSVFSGVSRCGGPEFRVHGTTISPMPYRRRVRIVIRAEAGGGVDTAVPESMVRSRPAARG